MIEVKTANGTIDAKIVGNVHEVAADTGIILMSVYRQLPEEIREEYARSVIRIIEAGVVFCEEEEDA